MNDKLECSTSWKWKEYQNWGDLVLIVLNNVKFCSYSTTNHNRHIRYYTLWLLSGYNRLHLWNINDPLLQLRRCYEKQKEKLIKRQSIDERCLLAAISEYFRDIRCTCKRRTNNSALQKHSIHNNNSRPSEWKIRKHTAGSSTWSTHGKAMLRDANPYVIQIIQLYF